MQHAISTNNDIYLCFVKHISKRLFRSIIQCNSPNVPDTIDGGDYNEGDIDSPQKDNQCGYYNIHEEVDHLPQPLQEQEASFRNLKDHKVTPQEVAELPYEVDLWVEERCRD